MTQKPYTLEQIAQHIGGKLTGDPSCAINAIAALDKAKPGEISFLNNPQYRAFLATTQASAVIVSPKDAEACTGNYIVVDNPYLGYAKAAGLFEPQPSVKVGVHPTAVVGENCRIAATARIGANCVLGNNVVVGEHTIINPGCMIGDNSIIGDNTLLYARVTLYHNIKIGNRAIVHSGVVLGADGFGMVNDRGIWYKIPQLGGVVIGDDVEIGANTTIDRGALEDTVIENGVKLDNLIHIAHNVRIGAHTAIAGTTVIAGSAKIGKHCMIGGGVAISGHLQITDQVILTAKTEVGSSITEPGVYSSGMPAQPNREWRKNIIRFSQLDDIARRLKKLEKNSL
jgi:UDP-3-O-[3-hydroxymyristoyl] glucosamine N-acyltransferase